MIEPPLTPFLAISRNNQPLEPLEQIIELWVHGKSPHTQRCYRREALKFLVMLGKPLELVTLADVQAYVTVLEQSSLAASSRARAIAAIKSLFSFAYHKTGLLKANPAGPVTAPKVKDALAERILSESDVQMMIRLEPSSRNQLLLRLIYIAGLRVSELTQLKWGSLQAREVGGQVLIYGKGGKTRTIKLPALLWQELQGLRGDAEMDAPVFISRKKKGHLTEVQVNRIVKAAAMRVLGLDSKGEQRKKVSFEKKRLEVSDDLLAQKPAIELPDSSLTRQPYF
ncbi:MAG: site-specific integrase [Chroococcidiopsidaceae cyanobacterium CP_BM_RX_35]|nr:site-specific integrase [Chroococcidiopsidaceae cyanobacterium CP_BM_RX_35]